MGTWLIGEIDVRPFLLMFSLVILALLAIVFYWLIRKYSNGDSKENFH